MKVMATVSDSEHSFKNSPFFFFPVEGLAGVFSGSFSASQPATLLWVRHPWHLILLFLDIPPTPRFNFSWFSLKDKVYIFILIYVAWTISKFYF